MPKTKHTGGAWSCQPETGGEWSVNADIKGPGGSWAHVATVKANSEGSALVSLPEAEANAMLCAAAPELLTLAHAVLLFHSEAWGPEQAARWKLLTGTDDATTRNLCEVARAVIAKAKGEDI